MTLNKWTQQLHDSCKKLMKLTHDRHVWCTSTRPASCGCCVILWWATMHAWGRHSDVINATASAAHVLSWLLLLLSAQGYHPAACQCRDRCSGSSVIL
jgi:hypothetical protein